MIMDNDQFRTKWQNKWADSNLYAAANFEAKPSCYVLDMFPYPSGNGLHVGHAVGYIGTDIIARKKEWTVLMCCILWGGTLLACQRNSMQ